MEKSKRFKYMGEGYATAGVAVYEEDAKILRDFARQTGQKIYFVAGKAIREYVKRHAKEAREASRV